MKSISQSILLYAMLILGTRMDAEGRDWNEYDAKQSKVSFSMSCFLYSTLLSQSDKKMVNQKAPYIKIIKFNDYVVEQ